MGCGSSKSPAGLAEPWQAKSIAPAANGIKDDTTRRAVGASELPPPVNRSADESSGAENAALKRRIQELETQNTTKRSADESSGAEIAALKRRIQELETQNATLKTQNTKFFVDAWRRGADTGANKRRGRPEKDKEGHRDVKLNPKLEAFVTLENAAQVQKVLSTDTLNLKDLQKAFIQNPSDDERKRRLSKHAKDVSKAIVAEVNDRLSTSAKVLSTLKECLLVIQIGNHSFSRVYTATWAETIKVHEASGIEAYKAETKKVMKVSGDQALQPNPEARDAVELWIDAVRAKKTFFEFFFKLIKKCREEEIEFFETKPETMDDSEIKDLLRVIEKCCLRPGRLPGSLCMDASNVTDILRGMLVLFDMNDISKVQRVLLKMATEDNEVVLDRTKDRLIATPSFGGCT